MTSDTHLRAEGRMHSDQAVAEATAQRLPEPEEAFDRFARLAARLLGAPAAAVTVIHEDGFVVRGRTPAGAVETAEAEAYSRRVAEAGEPLVVADGAAFVGVPLTTEDGRTLGALSVTAPAPRRWTGDEVAALGDLAATVAAKLEWRRERAERLRTEARLCQSEREYRGLFENAHDALVILDPADGRVLDANPCACELYGYTRAELLNATLDDFAVDAASSRGRVAETLAQTGVLPFESDQRRRDGTPLRVEINASVVEYDGGPAILGICRDVTERRRTEAALRDSESQLRAIFDEAAVGMAVVDLHGRLVRTNRALQSMLGYTAGELGNMLFSQLTHPDDVAADWELFGDLVAGERTQYKVEKRYFHADGSTLWTTLNVSMVRDTEGAPCFSVGIIEDVTERKRAEEALLQSQNELLQAQKMETVGRLAGGIAHDFNNLLTVITGNAQLLLAELPEESSMREELQEINAVSVRAADLTRQLLAFSRRQMLQPRVVDLNDTVFKADRLLRRVLGEDIEFRTSLDPALGAVRADTGQLEQVLMNLAVNARDAMPSGGKLTIETRNVWLDAEYVLRHPSVLPGPYVMVAVSDSGHGMDAETQARIFDPFFTTKAPGKGTGLGLATVYGIVRQSGGHVWVYSEVGRGTSFKVYLPRADEPPTLPAEASRAAEPRGGTETVLLVEDDESVRRLSRRVLERGGYTVIEANEGAHALRLAEAHEGPIHLVITDVVMPGMSGREVAERIASVRPGAEVLFTSGYTDDAIVHHGVLDDGMAFLQKPFDPYTLLQAVRDALTRTRH